MKDSSYSHVFGNPKSSKDELYSYLWFGASFPLIESSRFGVFSHFLVGVLVET